MKNYNYLSNIYETFIIYRKISLASLSKKKNVVDMKLKIVNDFD